MEVSRLPPAERPWGLQCSCLITVTGRAWAEWLLWWEAPAENVGDLVWLPVQGRLDFLHVTLRYGAGDGAVAAISAMNTGEERRKHFWQIFQYEDQKNQG